MSAFSAITRSVMSRRFSSISGLASWFGNVPSTSKQSVVSFFVGMCLKSSGATRPAIPLPASSTTLNGLRIGRVDERQDVLDVVVDDVLLRQRAARAAAGAGSWLAAIMSRMSPMPDSPDSGNASFRTILMPLYSLGLCDAVIWTPPSCPSRATAK